MGGNGYVNAPKRGKELSQLHRNRTEERQEPASSEEEDEDDLYSSQQNRKPARKSSKTRRSRNSRSDDSDSDQSTRQPLVDSIHHNRQRHRTDSHPDMAPTTRTAGRNKGRTSKAATPKERESDAIARQKAELDKLEKENKELKEKEELAKKRAKLIANSKAGGAESKAMTGLIKKIVNIDLWKVCKFIKNEKFLFKAGMFVLRKLNLQEMEGLEGDELVAAEKTWIESHQSEIASLLNDRRNYVMQQVGNLVRDHVTDGKVEELPDLEQMRKLVYREGMDSQVPKEEKVKLDALFDKYWDVLIPIVAGNSHWAPKFRHHSLLSFAKKDENVPDSEDLIHPTDEAFLLILWENSYNRWVYKATAGNGFSEKDPQAKPKYSSSPLGIKKFGQWDPAGIKAFQNAAGEVRKQRLPNEELEEPNADVVFIQGLEKEALQRIRKANKVVDDGPARKKRKTKGKKSAFDEEECDMEDDQAW